MSYFDYQSVAAEAGIPKDELDQLARLIREEFPRDDMMYELHVLRACMAIRDGFVSLEDALRPASARLQGRAERR
ncbi:MAG: hypothetical protein HY699_19600 [Deltaproteobacteria bacterium]|nr:hypothetical protein [Deltaproteobacteria bacterium]